MNKSVQKDASFEVRVEAQKKKLREQMRGKLKTLTPRLCKEKSLKIQNCLCHNSVFQKAKNILFYASLPMEVQTRRLIHEALKTGKHVFLPKVCPQTRQIQIGVVKELKADLVKGFHGILEPRRVKRGKIPLLNLILVPGLAFDRKGRRLGRGAGYYDRFLENHPKTKRFGLAFREQIVKRVPAQSHDIRMHQVITD